MQAKTFHLGFDLGSISLKAALLNQDKDVVFSKWMRIAGQPLTHLKNLIKEVVELYPDAIISSIGVTGSGRDLISEMMNAHSVNEISAHARAVKQMNPEIRSIIEIGGQDSKLMIIDDELAVKDFRMNELCAAGTGAFLDQQASRLGLSIEDFSLLALKSTDPAPIAGRCAVFAKTDMTHHQQEGRQLTDIVAGLNDALVRSYISNLVRGKELPKPIAFQGGVAENKGLYLSFQKILGLSDEELIVPKHYKVMGAIGAALIAADTEKQRAQPIINFTRIISKTETRSSVGARRAVPLQKPSSTPTSPNFKTLKLDGTYLGIDIGSVSVKVVCVTNEGIIFSDYCFSEGLPTNILNAIFKKMKEKIGELKFNGVGITGSGRHFIGKLIGADAIQNEITAQAISASFILPEVDSVVEIGGQDAKFLSLKGGRVTHFSMNRVCAAGTGAFLQEQAKRLNITLDDFANEAFSSDNPASLGARCTVFMESDLVSHQQQGYAKKDLVAGLAKSVVINYLEKVVGSHPIGNKVLFLGGVAENLSVVSALEAHLNKNVFTSQIGKLSGALGAAISAFEAKKLGVYKDSRFIPEGIFQKYEQFRCEDCSNRCQITKTIENLPRMFGGRCGKFDGDRKVGARRAVPLQRLHNHPTATIVGATGRSPLRNHIKIGIPRALFTFDKLPAWKTYFESLGCEIVLSPESNQDLLEEGMKHLVVETCLPVKAFCAHVHWLSKNGKIDFIFVPSLVATGEDKHGKETVHCPYIQGLLQFAKPLTDIPIINPVINWKMDPNDEELEMIKIASIIGVSQNQAKDAWKNAISYEEKFRAELCQRGLDILSKIKIHEIGRAFVLLGKDYNLHDKKLNSSAIEILESMGETLVTQDMIATDDGSYSGAYRTMYWSHGKEILAAAEIAAKTPNLYAIMITNFGCGPDSFTIKYVSDIMGEKPWLLLEVDEHSSSVGMETRIEAFLDSLKGAPNIKTTKSRQPFKPSNKIRHIFLPNFSDHGIAFAAAVRKLGFTPLLTSLPDDESARLGSANTTSGECHPFSLMLGDYIKVARSLNDTSNACYYMPEGGACRVGQFGTQIRLIADGLGLGLPIVTRISDLAPSIGKPSRSLYVNSILTYWEMMRGMDFLMQRHFETRAYEVVPGSTDRAREIWYKKLLKYVSDGQPKDGLTFAHKLLDAVKVDKTRPCVKIGITGDYYTRVCDYANGDIFRDIERLGGVVWLPPTMTEFIKYESHQKPTSTIKHKKILDFLQALLIKKVVKDRENHMRELVGDKIEYDIPLEYDRAMEKIKPYMDAKLPGGLTGSIAAIMEQIHAGADGILNIITFHCSYGLVISSTLSLIDKDYPDIPKLTLIFEGLKKTHNHTRLEAFMERVIQSKLDRARFQQ